MISPAFAQEMMDQLKGVIIALHGQLLLTTSRRTSLEVETVIKESLSSFPQCPLAVFPKEHNLPDAVGGILGLSDIVIVSSDSISMVSEAVSSGKTIIVFKPTSRLVGQVTKHDRFVDRLEDDGHVFLVKPQNLGSLIERIVKERL